MATQHGGTDVGSVAQEVLRLITGVVRNPYWGLSREQAEDEAMNIWLRLWEKCPWLFAPGGDDQDRQYRRRYILKATRGGCVDWVRRQYRQRRDPLDGAVSLDDPWLDNEEESESLCLVDLVRADLADEPEVWCMANEEKARLYAAIAALPPQQGKVVCLHDLEGKTFKEVADAMGITEGAVKRYYFGEALPKLRRALAEEPDRAGNPGRLQ
jgi:RNA polymerase sigma factor (sigma-70 family)